ncbi:MAG: tetratricopeptide repeat protein [Planctomycetota bacterium]|jgi:tetratricopeptide (TPR) repeat protein
MNRRCVILAAGVCLLAGTVSRSDSVKTTTQRVPLPGTIQQMTPFEVQLKVGVSTKKFPVNEIEYISYEREPAALTTARIAVLAGRYEDALKSLEKVNPDEQKRPVIKQDIEFYRALCRAELALGGSGEIKTAGNLMTTFVKTHNRNYHWLKANELVGDLYLAVGAYAKAEEYYSELSKAPWPDYKMRAGVAIGRAQLAQGTATKRAEALKSFESVLAMDATGELAKSQRLAATVGKARCQTANKQYDEAIKTLNGVIAKSDPEQGELNARTYNALGTALKNSGRTKEALLAFLHVDAIYLAVPETHAEALANLAELWEKVNKPGRAARARRILQERYENSPWAQ